MIMWPAPWRTVSLGATPSELPDGWYVATMDDGIKAGPFRTKKGASWWIGSPDPMRREGKSLYTVGRWWVGPRDAFAAQGFGVSDEVETPEEWLRNK